MLLEHKQELSKVPPAISLGAGVVQHGVVRRIFWGPRDTPSPDVSSGYGAPGIKTTDLYRSLHILCIIYIPILLIPGLL